MSPVKVKVIFFFFFFFCISGKPLSQGSYMSNMKALSETVNKLWPMLFFFFKVGHRQRSRSQVKIFCMSVKPLSQGTYMPKNRMKALSEKVQNLWPMLKLSNKQTNTQKGQKQVVPAIATRNIKSFLFLLFTPRSLHVCHGYLLESPPQGNSNKYPQHTFLGV